MLGTGDAIWFSDGKGNPLVPPNNPVNRTLPGTPVIGFTSALSEIENPNPQASTNNFYTQDGYGGGSGSPTAVAPNANYGGGSYSDCSDVTQPGVAPVLNYLNSLDRKVNPELRTAALLSSQQLQSRLFRRRHQRLYGHQCEQHRVHDPAVERAQHRRCSQRRRDLLGLFWRSIQPLSQSTSTIPSNRECVLQYLQLCSVLDLDHDQCHGSREASQGYGRFIRKHRERRPAAGGVLRQAKRFCRRPSGVVEAQSVRGLRQKDRRPRECQSHAMGRYGDH